MGVYSDRKVYGISLHLEKTLFEKTYLEEITLEQKEEVRQFYDSLTKEQKEKLMVRFFLSFKTPENTFTSWVPATNTAVEQLLQR